MSAELLLAIPPAVDLCRKYIKEGRQLCSALKHADYEVSERLVRLENNWVRFNSQLNFFQRVQHVMEDEHREVYDQTLQVLQNKLEIVVSLLKVLVKVRPVVEDDVTSHTYEVRRWKYACKKGGLDEAIKELETWQGAADQSWFLLLRIADSQVDEALGAHVDNTETSTGVSLPATIAIRAGLKLADSSSQGTSTVDHINLPPSHLKQMAIQDIPFCDGIAVATKTHSDQTASQYVLNQIQCELGSKPQILKRNVRDLVRKLQVNEPHTFSLLNCKGFVVESVQAGLVEQLSLTLVFRCPPALQNPRSLRDLLVNLPSATTSTTRRLEIARDLASSVGYVHTFGFVHKNVRPESVLIFERGEGISAFLLGFENFRRDEGWTQRRGDNVLDRNLYRHASRQGFDPHDDYEMRHDIYSLGVCLLEIGLWGSFVEYEVGTEKRGFSQLLVSPFGKGKEPVSARMPDQAKDRFVALARHRLPGCIGDGYAAIVETCLTCLDPGNADFGNETEFKDADEILVGARYIEKVLLRLSKLSM